MVFIMFKWFTQLFADDTYHIFEPGEAKDLFAHTFKWLGILVLIALYTIYAVATELVLKPVIKFVTGIRTALRDEDPFTD